MTLIIVPSLRALRRNRGISMILRIGARKIVHNG